MENEVPNILIKYGWTQEMYDFFIFMTDLDKKSLNRARNALIRGGIHSIKQFAESDPNTFTAIRGISFLSMKPIMERYNKAREQLSMEPIELDYDKLVDNYKEKLFNNKVAYRELCKRFTQ